jgi:hypothetical protein
MDAEVNSFGETLEQWFARARFLFWFAYGLEYLDVGTEAEHWEEGIHPMQAAIESYERWWEPVILPLEEEDEAASDDPSMESIDLMVNQMDTDDYWDTLGDLPEKLGYPGGPGLDRSSREQRLLLYLDLAVETAQWVTQARAKTCVQEGRDLRVERIKLWVWCRVLESCREVAQSLRMDAILAGVAAARMAYESYAVFTEMRHQDRAAVMAKRLRIQGLLSRYRIMEDIASYEVLSQYRKSPVPGCQWRRRRQRLRRLYGRGDGVKFLLGQELREWAMSRDRLDDWFILHRWGSKFVHADPEQTKVLFPVDDLLARHRNDWLVGQLAVRTARIYKDAVEVAREAWPQLFRSDDIDDAWAALDGYVRGMHASGSSATDG